MTPEDLKAARRAEIWLVVLTIICIAVVGWFGMGCITLDDIIPQPPVEPPVVVPTLPTNPEVGQDLPDSISEQWSIKRKDYDQTWRIAWPSHFSNAMGIGAGSYCTANGHRAEYRGQDKDYGANRPKYTMPLSTELQTPVECILYGSDGVAVGWFRADRVNVNGRLP